jgi:hypothetical protein
MSGPEQSSLVQEWSMQTVRVSRLTRAAGALASITLGTYVVATAMATALATTLGAQDLRANVAAAPQTVALPSASAPIQWTPAAAFPVALDHHVTFITSGTRGDWLHVIGGQDAGGKLRGTAYQAKIARDGSLGAWEAGEAFPAGLAGMAITSDGRYAVIAGGRSSASTATQEVYLAHIWGDGRLGAFKAAPFSLPAARAHTGAVIADGNVYVIGGNDGTSATSTVYRAKISRTGALGVWSTLEALPGARSHHAALVHDGAIYVVAGIAGDPAGDAKPLNDVLRATINKDGTLGAWQTVSTLDAAFSTHAAVVHDGHLYVIGGVEDGAKMSDRVVRAAINKDGSLGAWESTGATLPAPRGNVSQVPVLRDRLYSVGGSRSGKALDDVVVGKFGN